MKEDKERNVEKLELEVDIGEIMSSWLWDGYIGKNFYYTYLEEYDSLIARSTQLLVIFLALKKYGEDFMVFGSL
jgi:hypothetical protein